MSKDSARCIYCPVMFDPSKGEGDHVVPRGFGDFEGAIIFRGVCPSCNNKLSVLEEELLRTAPEAVLRRLAGVTQNRRGKSIGWQGASGLPAPRFVIRHADHDELIEADPTIPGQAGPVDHLAVVLKDDRNVHIRLFPSMSADALRRKLEQRGINEADIAHLYWHSDDEHTETFKSLLKEMWPDHRHVELPAMPAGLHRVPVRIEFRFTQKYYRAIAKIAFHYLLAKTQCGYTGYEGCFEPIRKFIMEGGEHKQFFDAQKPRIALPVGILPDGTAMLPARWMHQLCSFESAASVVVAVYILFGPECPPSPHFVTLLHRPSPVAVPNHQYGHAYIYGKTELGDTRTAFVDPINVGLIE